jgi:hypothetical protein
LFAFLLIGRTCSDTIPGTLALRGWASFRQVERRAFMAALDGHVVSFCDRTMTTKPPPLPLTGGFSCGAIRYEIASFPLLLYTCNCTECQTASGSAFALNMPVLTEAFRIVRGSPKCWRQPSPSGADVTLPKWANR